MMKPPLAVTLYPSRRGVLLLAGSLGGYDGDRRGWIASIAFSSLAICHCLAFLAIGSVSFSCLLSSLLRFLISPLILPSLHPWRGMAGLPLFLARIASFHSLLPGCNAFDLGACGTFTKNRLYFSDNSSAGILCDPSL